MAFVNEKIPEAEKNKFNFQVKTYPDGSKPTLYKWTIDRERNAVLVKTSSQGGNADGLDTLTEYYALCWQNDVIHFAGDPRMNGDRASGQVMNWFVHDLVVPPHLQDHIENILQLVRDALDAKGWLYDRSCLIAVNVEFAPFHKN